MARGLWHVKRLPPYRLAHVVGSFTACRACATILRRCRLQETCVSGSTPNIRVRDLVSKPSHVTKLAKEHAATGVRHRTVLNDEDLLPLGALVHVGQAPARHPTLGAELLAGGRCLAQVDLESVGLLVGLWRRHPVLGPGFLYSSFVGSCSGSNVRRPHRKICVREPPGPDRTNPPTDDAHVRTTCRHGHHINTYGL